MKELSIEEKAKAYDEALKVLHKYDGANIMFSQSLKEEMFPELKESEDEKMRKYIKQSLENLLFTKGSQADIERNNAIAWLEKQGGQKHIPKHKIGDTISYNSFGELKSMIVANVVTDGTDNPMYEDKEGNAVFEKDLIEQKSAEVRTTGYWNVQDIEQKSANDIERKYNPCYNMSFEEAQEYISNRGFDIPWTDCDVFVDFKYVTQTVANILRWADNNPKQKPAWSEEDELSCFECALFTAFSDAWQEYLNGEEVNVEKWAKEHSKELLEAAKEELKEQTQAWSEEDETKLKSACALIRNTSLNGNEDVIDSTITFLKSLKGRVQPKQEWSEEDREMRMKVLKYLSTRCNVFEYEEVENWLKSLKDRYTWKPSKEQMVALKHAFNDGSIDFADMKILATLYEQLKALHRYEQDT